jgi:hypothetical protein
MPIIEVPGQGQIEFPDSMNDEQIVMAIKRMSPAPAPGKLEAVGRGLAQGGTMGAGDELAGLGAATQNAVASQPELAGVPDAELYALARSTTRGEDYKQTRDEARGKNKSASDAHPGLYFSGEVAGAMAPAALSALLGGAAAAAPGKTLAQRLLSGRALAASAGQGALQGAGYSDASTPGAIAGDSALGAGVGSLSHGAGAALGVAGEAITSRLRGMADAARGRAGAQAEAEVADRLRTAIGRYGSEVQKGSRMGENLGRIGTPLSAEEQAIKTALEEQVGASTKAALPGQASTIAARKAELEALQAGAGDATATRAAELSKSSVGEDLKSLLKSYAEPLAAAYAADKLGSVAGLSDDQRHAADAVTGLVFSRTRAGKAIANRLRKPGNQIAIAEALSNLTPTEDGPLSRLLRGLTAPATEPALSLRR